MSNMFLAIERARSLCYFAVAAINEDTPNRATAVSMAKAAATTARVLVGRESIQSFGGIGFTWEHDAHLYVKRADHRWRAVRRCRRALGRRRRQPRGRLRLRRTRLAPCAPANRSLRLSTWNHTPRAAGTGAPGWPRPRTGHGPPGAPSTTSCWRARSRRRTASTPPSCGTSTPVTRSSCSREWPDGRRHVQVLGPDVAAGHAPQVVVEAGVWQSARPLGRYALVGATVTPAFSFEGFELRQDPG